MYISVKDSSPVTSQKNHIPSPIYDFNLYVLWTLPVDFLLIPTFYFTTFV